MRFQPKRGRVNLLNKTALGIISALLPLNKVNNLIASAPALNTVQDISFTPAAVQFGFSYSYLAYTDADANFFRRSTFTHIIQFRLKTLASGYIYTVDGRFTVALGQESVAGGKLGISWYDGIFYQFSFTPQVDVDYTFVTVATPTGVAFYVNGALIGSVVCNSIVFAAGRGASYGFVPFFSQNGCQFDLKFSAFSNKALTPDVAKFYSRNCWNLLQGPPEDELNFVVANTNTAINPVNASEVLTRYAPTLTQTAHQSMSPAPKAMVLSTYIPSVVSGANQGVSPAARAITLTGYAPTITQSLNQGMSPAPASEVLVGYAPSISYTAHQGVSPAVLNETITGFIPAITQSNNVEVSPATKNLVETVYAPTVTQSDHHGVSPAPANILITGFAPVIFQPVGLSPALAAETLTGYAPSVSYTAHLNLVPATASLSIAGLAPSITQSSTSSFTPAPAVITIGKPAPSITKTGHQQVSPAPKSIVIEGQVPSIVRTVSSSLNLSPATKNISVLGFAPTITFSGGSTGGGGNSGGGSGGCPSGVCGTGGWNGPLPGDPDNNVFLSANTVYGGINVTWSYPLNNPQAVAFTRVYRAVSANFALAVLQHEVGSSVYHDVLDPVSEKEYFYWIQIVSVNGTVGDTIGPASAIARPMSKWTLETLSGLIDKGVLATSLRTEIARIPEISDHIFQEITDRLAANVALQAALALVTDVTNETLIRIQQEITQRQDADGVFVNSMNLLYAQYAGAAAAILEEKTIRVTKDEALAQSIDALSVSYTNAIQAAIVAERVVRVNAEGALATNVTTLFANYNTATAAIIAEQTARSNADGAIGTNISSLYTITGNNATAISNEQTARTTATSALATDISTLFTKSGDNTAAIQTEQTARVNGDNSVINYSQTLFSQYQTNVGAAINNEATARTNADGALASQITTVQTTMNGNIASVQQTMQSQINAVTGELNAIWTAKVDVNGLVGGFGIYGTPSQVEAGFDVDLFWVGRGGNGRTYPFIIAGNNTYIKSAIIQDAAIDTLKVAGNAITGLSVATGGSASVPASGTTLLVGTNLTMPAGGSGVLIDVNVSISSSQNSTQLLVVYKNGLAIGSSGISLTGGFGTTGVLRVLDANPTTGSAQYQFGVSNPNSGPGANVAATVTASAIVVSGAKR